MPTKYWYKAANGSDNWSVATNWYLGSGGTGGTTAIPTGSDDVIFDSNSGTGTITIATTSTCKSLSTNTFNGVVAGTASLSISGSDTGGYTLRLPNAQSKFTYSGPITFVGAGGYITTGGGLTISGSLTFNSSTGVWSDSDFYGLRTLSTMSIAGGTLNINASNAGFSASAALFSTSGAVTRSINLPDLYLTGTGTVLNLNAGTSGSINNRVVIADQSSNTKTITQLATTATIPYLPILVISGSGTGTYNISGNYSQILVAQTGGATVSFTGATLTTNGIDFAQDQFNNYVPSNVNLNSAIQTVTIGGGNLIFSSNMTVKIGRAHV